MCTLYRENRPKEDGEKKAHGTGINAPWIMPFALTWWHCMIFESLFVYFYSMFLCLYCCRFYIILFFGNLTRWCFPFLFSLGCCCCYCFCCCCWRYLFGYFVIDHKQPSHSSSFEWVCLCVYFGSEMKRGQIGNEWIASGVEVSTE